MLNCQMWLAMWYSSGGWLHDHCSTPRTAPQDRRCAFAADWNNALDWIESQIVEVLGDPAFKNGDGPVTREEFEKVVGG